MNKIKLISTVVTTALLLTNTSFAELTGSQGGETKVLGLAKKLEIKSAVCTTEEHKIFFSSVVHPNIVQDESFQMTYTVINSQTGALVGIANSPLGYLPELTGFEAGHINAYVWTYYETLEDTIGFVTFYMEGAETVEAGTYETKARIAIPNESMPIYMSDAVCVDVEIN